MDSSDARLDIVEAQRSTDVSPGVIYMVRYLLSHASSMLRPQVPLRSRGEGTLPPAGVIYMVWDRLLTASSFLRPQVFFRNREEGTPPPTGVIYMVRHRLLTASSFLRPQIFLRSREEGTPPPPPTGVIYMAWHRLWGALSIFSQFFFRCRGEGTQPPTGLINMAGDLLLNASSYLRPRVFFGSREEGTPPPAGDTESVPEFVINLRLSDFYDIPGEYVLMSPEIFIRVSNGNKECLEKLKNHGTPMACLQSDQGDSVLHLAASWGHPELVKSIISECPCLLWEPNSKDQLPIHVAAHAGHSAVVEALVATLTFGAKLFEEARERLNQYVMEDINGDTPLHLALKRRYKNIASLLVKANQQASFLANNQGISPLYMAVEAGYVSLVKEMLETRGDEGKKSKLDSKLEGRKCLVHAALKSRKTDILDVILNDYRSLGDELDEEGRTCLSFGAYVDNYRGLRKILDRSTNNVCVRDKDGSFPTHIAAEKGHANVLKEILRCCPDSKHLVNKQGQNMLHIAAKFGQHRLVRSLMLHPDTRHLGLGQDVDGNTPLHLATINWSSNCVFSFVWNENILQLRNNSGLRARDIAESKVNPNYIYQERLTLALLLYATHTLEEPIKSMTIPSKPRKGDDNKEYVNILLLVAALVAAMTFAAGFTMPGGFNSSGRHLGRETLANDPTLFIFLLLDILALQSSVATIATLIWAQMGDQELVRKSLNVALPLMLFALLCMPLAFLFGMVTAIEHVRWFLTVICVISSIFFYWALFILGPHVLLQISDVSPDSLGEYFVLLFSIKNFFGFYVAYYLTC